MQYQGSSQKRITEKAIVSLIAANQERMQSFIKWYKCNVADLSQPLINIYFPKIVDDSILVYLI
jgi:hypothetical protein